MKELSSRLIFAPLLAKPTTLPVPSFDDALALRRMDIGRRDLPLNVALTGATVSTTSCHGEATSYRHVD